MPAVGGFWGGEGNFFFGLRLYIPLVNPPTPLESGETLIPCTGPLIQIIRLYVRESRVWPIGRADMVAVVGSDLMTQITLP